MHTGLKNGIGSSQPLAMHLEPSEGYMMIKRGKTHPYPSQEGNGFAFFQRVYKQKSSSV